MPQKEKMRFLKKIFGSGKEEDPPKEDSHFDNYRKELEALDLATMEDLEKLVKPLIRQATIIELQPASRPPENSQMNSHFGGQPYFEHGEVWPRSKSGRNLSFIFQIFNQEGLELPAQIKLIQFFYDFESYPWDTADDGWLVKIYKEINPDKIQFIERPEELDFNKYCEVKFRAGSSLPDWEGIDLYDDIASKLNLRFYSVSKMKKFVETLHTYGNVTGTITKAEAGDDDDNEKRLAKKVINRARKQADLIAQSINKQVGEILEISEIPNDPENIGDGTWNLNRMIGGWTAYPPLSAMPSDVVTVMPGMGLSTKIKKEKILRVKFELK